MSSRMDKYSEGNLKTSRTSKNRNLYEEVDRIDVGYISLNEPNILEIPNNNEKRLKTREDYKRYRDLDGIISVPKEEKASVLVKEKEERIYDINEILKKAKEELKEEKNTKRLLNTEYNILTKLDLENIEKLEKNDLNEEELKKIVEEVYPTKENKVDEDDDGDFFDDLKEETIKEEILEKKTEDIAPVENKLKEDEEYLNKTIIDTTIDTDLIKIKKSNKSVILIVIFVILLLGGLIYLLLNYFNVI